MSAYTGPEARMQAPPPVRVIKSFTYKGETAAHDEILTDFTERLFRTMTGLRRVAPLERGVKVARCEHGRAWVLTEVPTPCGCTLKQDKQEKNSGPRE